MKSTRLACRASRRPAPRPVVRAARELLGPPGAALAISLGLMPLPAAWAGPQGGQVTAGQASIQTQGATTTVNQASARAAIDWQSFSVGAHETVRFQQPSASSVVLNRVVGPDPSAIFGRITANGQVLLINPNGILFGRSAQVDVGGLVASTANVSNADFMAGRLAFTQPGRPGAAVVNEGRITVADGGLAALVGRTVANRGVIEARLGTVALAGGDAFVLDLYGDRLVNLVVDPAALATLTDAQGVPLAARVDQQGRIHADGGVVQLAAATVSRLVDSLINVGGTVRATSFEQQPGRIVLRGDEGTKLNLAGSVDVSGLHGGRIEATAGKVQLASTARLDASGDLGGGRIAVGGEWQGGGELPNAKQVDVAQGALLDASARRQGDGGTVVVWSDGDTRFEGRIAARGGAGGGDGGQVEVSGRQRLGFDGDVMASAGAAGGRAGMLLLDPQNLVIDGASGSSTLPSADTPGDYTVRASAVNRQLVNGTSVTLQATQDLTLTAGTVVDARATSGATPGAGLTLTAGRDIALNGLVILNDGAFNASAGGRFTQAADGAVATGSGAIAVTAAGNVAASNLLTSGAVTLRSTAGSVNVSRAVSGLAGRGGALTIEGRGGVTLGAGALVGAATLTSAQGAVDTGAATLDAAGAIALTGASVTTGALITPAAVTVTSGGAVSLGAVAGAAGTVDAQTAKAQGLTIATPGAVTLGGAALGAGGLTVHGASAGDRAGAVGLGAASVFSDGDVTVRASAITLAAAGIASGGALALDAGGALATGSGKLQSTGAMTLAAGGTAALGDGGAESGAALTIDGGTLQLDGALRSTAAVQLQAAQGIALNRNVNAASFAATAGAGFTQAAGSAVAAGAVTIASTGTLAASNLIATGAVNLTSSQGAVTVSGALASGADRTDRIASLQASGRDGVTLGGGALVAGTTTLSSAQGAVTTTAATLDSVGAVTINGTSVATGALVTPAAVTVASAGAVSLGAVAAADGTVGASSLPAAGLVVATPGAVTLGGAALGAGGLTVRGASAGLRAGAVGFGNASIFSAGDVVVDAASITLADAGIASGAALRLDASGTVASGAGKLQSAGAMTLVAGSSAAIGTGGAESTAGTLTVTGTALTLTGDLRSAGLATLSALQDLRVDGDIVAASLDATAGGRFVQAGPSKVAADSIEIAAAGGIAASNLLGSGAMRLGSSAGTVVVAEALSGAAGTRAGSLQVEGRDGVTLAKGALAGGTTALNSSAGAISLGATLDSGGGITLQGASVTAMALLSSGDVAVTSTGAVTLGGVAGEAGAINATRAKARSLLVATPGSVTLAGAALDSGGLGVRGANAGDRAGAVTFGDGSVFSDGAVRVDATTITLGAAGVAGGGTLTLDASAALTTGAGAVQGAGAVALSAGGDLSVGSGGARSTGSTLSLSGDALSVTGAQGLAGALGSAGAMTLSAARGITLDANVAAGGFTATAGTTFDQGASRSIDAGAGGLDITVAGELATGTLLAAGAVRLQSTQGAVNVRGAVGGAGDARVASLRVDGLDGVTLHAGARVAGTTELTSTGGAVTTSAATLDSRGDITLQGASVTTAALLSAGTVTADSAGAIVLGGVAGEAGEINENRDKAARLVVRTPGAVTLGGAALGTGGLLVGGANAGERAATVDFGSASVFSSGDVRVDAASVSLAAAGIQGSAAVALDVTAAIATGSAAIEAGTDLSLVSAASISIAGAGAGGASAGRNLSLTAAGDIVAAGPLATDGGTITIRSTAGNVELHGVQTNKPSSASSGTLDVQGGNVVFVQPLGGENTGYGRYQDDQGVLLGYRAALRPNVGKVVVSAREGIEVNGLNLDGKDDPAPAPIRQVNALYVGLTLVAGDVIVSNGLIAVNKGDIQLRTERVSSTSGIYLGHSIYSRGHVVGDAKTAYNIRVDSGFGTDRDSGLPRRNHVILFDNTDEEALFQDVVTGATRSVAKIIISNNVANFRFANGSPDPRVVAATNVNQALASYPLIYVQWDEPNATLPRGVESVGPIRLASLPSRNVPMEQGANEDASGVAGSGVALKIQFHLDPEYLQVAPFQANEPTVRAVSPVPVRYSDVQALQPEPACVAANTCTYAQLGIPRVDGRLLDGTTFTASQRVGLESYNAGANYTDPSLPGYQANPTLGYNTAGFFPTNWERHVDRAVIYGRGGLTSPDVILTVVREVSVQAGSVGYEVRDRLTEVSSDTNGNLIRMLFYPVTKSSAQQAFFNDTGGLQGGSGDPTGGSSGNMGGTGNSSTGVLGFPALGNFGPQGTTSVGGASGGTAGSVGFGGLQPGSAGGNGGNGFSSGVGFGGLQPGSAAGGAGNGAGTTVAFGTLVGGNAAAAGGNGAVLPPAGPPPTPDRPEGADGGTAPSTLRPSGEAPDDDDGTAGADGRDIVIGSRPAALADLGRGSASSGSAPNVLRKRFRLAVAADESVCAPGDLQPAGGASNRLCPPDR
ncbi:MAG: filamentous hemagglutinin N-terminal domain-containing protein [Rubrivivax sp.]|nr:filamentous hemagglutinin N-terminal domain-containing protein [Rubrivivax sp.]